MYIEEGTERERECPVRLHQKEAMAKLGRERISKGRPAVRPIMIDADERPLMACFCVWMVACAILGIGRRVTLAVRLTHDVWHSGSVERCTRDTYTIEQQTAPVSRAVLRASAH